VAQFDFHRYARKGARAKFLLDLQSDLLQALGTRVVAPIYEKAGGTIQGLNPELELNNKTYFISMVEMAAVSRSELGERVGSLASRRGEIISAVDLIFSGI
jgi:toxin CcdB